MRLLILKEVRNNEKYDINEKMDIREILSDLESYRPKDVVGLGETKLKT